jgi:hypothetical protein
MLNTLVQRHCGVITTEEPRRYRGARPGLDP